MKNTEKLQTELVELLSEKNNLEKIIADAKIAEERLKLLVDSWRDNGEISIKKQEIEDSKYPIFSTYGFINTRIVDINDKWISIKQDGINKDITRYKLDNGWRERARNDNCSIDAKKAIEIWEKHYVHINSTTTTKKTRSID